ncbi:Methyltransferase FkbM [Gracilaria domingensis]|nr:Methyltransferase FkbM [Gracilaria domingensis]
MFRSARRPQRAQTTVRHGEVIRRAAAGVAAPLNGARPYGVRSPLQAALRRAAARAARVHLAAGAATVRRHRLPVAAALSAAAHRRARRALTAQRFGARVADTHALRLGFRRASRRFCHKPDDWREYTARGVWMFSQFMQDAYLYIKHFSRLNRRGVYLDIASNDPIKISNTYFYDRCLGWRGMCVEANDKYFESTYRERSCQLVPTCVGTKPGEKVKFRLRGEVGGVVGDSYKFNNDTRGVEVERLCTTAQTVLDRNRVSHIDLLSLDVEGFEMQVLSGIDFSRTRIDVILIEVTPCFDEAKQLLEGLGYERIVVGEESKKSRVGPGYLGLDAIFVRGDVKFGFPE